MSVSGISNWKEVADRAFQFFAFYGDVNGVGQTWVDATGVRNFGIPREEMFDAISITFEKLSVPLELVPTAFAGYPVVAEEIGPIVALSAECQSMSSRMPM